MLQVQKYYLGTERLSAYRPGGYHPVLIGDIVHQRYKVINKLGAGAYSLVWLVEDLHSGRFVSLKIVTASSAASRERDVIHHLKESQEGTHRNSPGREFVMEILDDFLLDGPNGVHLCIVTELLGPAILHEWGWDDRFREDDEEFPPTHAKKICVQAAQGLAYLHRCNIVHGDLNRGNLVLRIPGVERWTRQDVEKYFAPSQPRIQKLIDNQGDVMQSTSPNVPQYLVGPPDPDLLIQLCVESIENFNIKICDFGESFIWDGTPKHIESNMPHDIAAPEVLLRAPLTPSVDVWALACVMYRFLAYDSLFPGRVRDHTLRSMVLSLGKFPDSLWTRWEGRKEYFDEDGHCLRSGYPKASMTIEPSEEMTQLEASAFEHLVRRMVSLDAEKRMTMDEVVRCLPKECN